MVRLQLPPAPPAFARDAGAGEGCRAEVRRGRRRAFARTSRATARQASGILADSRHELHLRLHPAERHEFRSPLHRSDGRSSGKAPQTQRGEVVHTAKFKPWVIKTAIAFRDRERTVQFERYLKTGSGRAFARKHL